MGLPINYIELGNEAYLSDPVYRFYFPTVQSYIRKVNAWIPVIRRQFPSAQIGVVGESKVLTAGGIRPSLRWNRAVIDGVHGEDAVTFHIYYSSNLPRGASIENSARLRVFLATAAQTALQRLKHDVLPHVPKRLRVWITEWNLFPARPPTLMAAGTWAQALTEMVFAIGLMDLPAVQLSDNHALAGGQFFGALFDGDGTFWTKFAGRSIALPPGPHKGAPYQPTNSGLAFTVLNRSLRGASSASDLLFTPNPAIRGTSTPGLLGKAFADAGGLKLFVVNLTDKKVDVRLGTLSGFYTFLSYSADPTSVVAGGASVRAGTGTATNAVTVSPYSVTSLVSF